MTLRALLRNPWCIRAGVFAGGLMLMLSGVRALMGGRVHYPNYWGGAVFAPFAIAIGVAVLVGLVWKWKGIGENETGTPRLRGRAARKARQKAEQAEKTRFPIDDYSKPWNG